MSYYSDNNFKLQTQPTEESESLKMRHPLNFSERVNESMERLCHDPNIEKLQVVIVAQRNDNIQVETHISTNMNGPSEAILGSNITTTYQVSSPIEADRLFYRLNEALEVHTHDPDDNEHILDIGNGDGFGHSITMRVGSEESTNEPLTYSKE